MGLPATHGPLKLQTMTMGSMSLDMIEIAGDPWFYAPSLARTLEYRDASNILRSVLDDEKGTYLISTPGGPQRATMINEWGLYRVVTRSNSAVAEPFRRWVFREVLPAIRKTGQYRLHEEAKRLGVSFDFTEAQWERLKELGFLPKVIEPRIKQLERRIREERAIALPN